MDTGDHALEVSEGLPQLDQARWFKRVLTLWQSRWRVAVAFAPMVIITLGVFKFGHHLSDLSSLGYLGLFVANMVMSGTFVLTVPATAAAVVGGAVANPLLVALFGGTGSAIGELLAYQAGASLQSTLHSQMTGKRWYATIRRWVRHRGFLTVFLLAALPNPLLDLAGFASGSTGYPLRRFIVACWLGKMIKFTVFALIGSWSAAALQDFIG